MRTANLEFERNDGPFRGRQHIVNHVNMILGLGNKFHSSFRKGRLAHIVAPELGIDRTMPISHLSENDLRKTRDWLLEQCLYAKQWEQLLPIEGDYYLGPSDFQTLDDGMHVLNACEDEWVRSDYGGDRSSFWNETPVIVLLAFWECTTCDRIVVRMRPGPNDTKMPVPVNGRAMMSAQHGDSTAWRAFAVQAAKNEYMRTVLYERQRGICAICGNELCDPVVVHHVDYDHECEFAISSENWTLSKSRVRPDCRRCHANHAALFENCASRLRAVHQSCNYLIEATL